MLKLIFIKNINTDSVLNKFLIENLNIGLLLVLAVVSLTGCKNSDKQKNDTLIVSDNSANEEVINLGITCESYLADLEGNVYYNNASANNEKVDGTSDKCEEVSDESKNIYDAEENEEAIQEENHEENENIADQAQKEADDYKLFCVDGKDSRQKLSYVVYTPNGCDENVPIFIFLHGNGDKAQSFEAELKRYAFLRHLNDGTWKPPVIFIMPIAQKKSSWSREADSVASIIDEVIENYGGSYDDLYISGASAGSDGLTAVAKKFDFKGAIYMAGHIAGSGNDVPKSDWLELWKDKKVYYYRDDKNSGGGYGYSQNASYMNGIEDSTDEYDVNFDMVDLKWNHDIGLVDATFLPSEFTDANGRPCMDGISKLISGE